jgi:hypothetical protein
MLFSLFDGDPDKWIDFLESHGTADERRNDLPFAEELKRRITRDARHLDRLRQVVRDFSMLV